MQMKSKQNPQQSPIPLLIRTLLYQPCMQRPAAIWLFCGEYAAQSDKTGSTENHNNGLTALSEAAFMTGLERNAGVLNMASYAPLFAHIDGWQWKPDLIWLDNLKSY